MKKEKINNVVLSSYQLRAKSTQFTGVLFGSIFVVIGLIILISELIGGNLISGIFGGGICLIIGTYFFFAKWRNKIFLKKTKAKETYGKILKDLGRNTKKVFKN